MGRSMLVAVVDVVSDPSLDMNDEAPVDWFVLAPGVDELGVVMVS